MQIFKMPIGDWSNDGHGQVEYYIVESNYPLSLVREAHFKIKASTGIDIERLCSKYGECMIKDPFILADLGSLGFEFEYGGFEDDGFVVDQYDMARLWCFLLEKSMQGLKLEIQPDNTPMLPFYGFDEKNRHIGYVGYGLFD